MSTLIIAEAGVNHNGDIELAKTLIDIAASSGADIVKFQSFDAKNLVTASAAKADYQLANTSTDESQLEMLMRLQLSEKQHQILKNHAESQSIEYLSSAFDIQSLRTLMKLGQKRIKVPSGEITNIPYLRFIAKLNTEIMLSTGMCTLAEIGAAIKILETQGLTRRNIKILHCTSDYPARIDEVNLRAMKTIQEFFGVEVGYSDHTEGIEVSIAAVALGATIIEKHFTIDKNLPGPDHQASLEPSELLMLVESIRNIELAMGSETKSPSAAELRNALAVRKSIVALKPIKRGDFYTEENLTTKRPGVGISPMEWDSIIGLRAPKDFEIDELIIR